jgi:hypothetical protein
VSSHRHRSEQLGVARSVEVTGGALDYFERGTAGSSRSRMPIASRPRTSRRRSPRRSDRSRPSHTHDRCTGYTHQRDRATQMPLERRGAVDPLHYPWVVGRDESGPRYLERACITGSLPVLGSFQHLPVVPIEVYSCTDSARLRLRVSVKRRNPAARSSTRTSCEVLHEQLASRP